MIAHMFSFGMSSIKLDLNNLQDPVAFNSLLCKMLLTKALIKHKEFSLSLWFINILFACFWFCLFLSSHPGLLRGYSLVCSQIYLLVVLGALYVVPRIEHRLAVCKTNNTLLLSYLSDYYTLYIIIIHYTLNNNYLFNLYKTT